MRCFWDKRISCLIWLLFASCLCYAQDELPTITADRPGALTGTDIMPQRKIQWETGIAYEAVVGEYRNFTLNTTLLRYGLFRNFELRVDADLIYDKAMNPTVGIGPLCVGFKARFYEGERFLPSIALLAQINSRRIGTKSLLSERHASSVLLLFEHSLSDRFGLGYNFGVEWDGQNASPAAFLGIGAYFDITECIGTFIEGYNYLHPDIENQYLTEFGFTWMVSRRVQLDFATDLDLLHLNSYHVLSIGVSWLIN